MKKKWGRYAQPAGQTTDKTDETPISIISDIRERYDALAIKQYRGGLTVAEHREMERLAQVMPADADETEPMREDEPCLT